MTTPDFSHLKAAELDGERERPYQFRAVEGTPTIWFRPALNENKAFLNETIRRSNDRAPGSGRQQTTDASIELARDEDRQVIASTCATRWDVKDAKGKDVPFTPENCLAYLRALPNWLVDGLRNWASEPSNWMRGAENPALGEP